MGAVLRQSFILLKNDLRQESRRLELVLSSVFFTVVLLVLYGVAFVNLPDDDHPKTVPGMLWIGVAFVGVLTLSRLFERERESRSLEALLASPIERVSIYCSKCLMTLLVLTLCGCFWLPGLYLMFPGAQGLATHAGAAALSFVLGALGYCAIGTLFAAGLAIGGAKNVLLSVVLYPLTTPVLLLSLAASQRILEDHPEFWSSVLQLAAVDVILLMLAAWIFESVLVGSHQPSPSAVRAMQVGSRTSAS